MLTKAILTGGVLSVLAGSIVYFGTEGADASEAKASDIFRVEETELAGAPAVAVTESAEVKKGWGKIAELRRLDPKEGSVEETDVQDPPPSRSKPKTNWLDQYLKRAKPEKAANESASEEAADLPSEMASETETIIVLDDPGATFEEIVTEDASAETFDLETADMEDADGKQKIDMRIKKRKDKTGARGEAKGRYVVSEDLRAETGDAEENVDIQILRDEMNLDDDQNIEIRVIRKIVDGESTPHGDAASNTPTDYAPILVEAKKLLVTDMRNQAFLEIIDHAVDQGDVAQAADIVEELSTPELRDTARARIGTGLARRGKRDAAFAVLDEIEIDELSAPIRLEIITALMATKQERKNFGTQR